MVLLWQRHATAQGLVTRQDAFCFRCALQDLSDQIQKLKAEIGKQTEAQAATVPLKLGQYLPRRVSSYGEWRSCIGQRQSAETADATTSVAEAAS
jgi:hypothetical protein